MTLGLTSEMLLQTCCSDSLKQTLWSLWLEYRMVVACQTSRISISKVIRRAGPAWTLKKMELVVHLGLNDTHLSWRGDPLDKIPLQ